MTGQSPKYEQRCHLLNIFVKLAGLGNLGIFGDDQSSYSKTFWTLQNMVPQKLIVFLRMHGPSHRRVDSLHPLGNDDVS